MIKTSEKSLTQRFDDSISSFSSEKRIKFDNLIYTEVSPRTVYIQLSNFILFSLENDDMESSKRCVRLFSLVVFIRCLTKSNFIRIFIFVYQF